MPLAPRHLVLLSCGLFLLSASLAAGAERPRVGPETEKRFPPLKLPAGFKATLFACDPFIEYPSAICAGPRPGSLFVAVDYMTGLGLDIVRRDEIRLVEDTDGDGYADKSTVYARGFNSIMGLDCHDGALYVMHAPYLSVIRDTKGVGDERRDLLTGLGLTPEANPVRLHCANGVVFGHDGWLYLALGDLGCDVKRPEGDRLVLHGGGILRCRPDGRDLHVFATGLRNIYDIVLDDDLNVFVRDNENDGGTYMIRVCHSFFGADHGYPYLYQERPDEALPPLADLGLGSSAGGVCYREQAFPPEFRGNLFFCEWGRSIVRYPLHSAGSGFGPVKEIEFAAAADDDPYGFKPTDLVVQRDGALFAADWADGQRPKRGRGRIYRIVPIGHKEKVEPQPLGLEANIRALDSASAYRRIDAQAFIEKQGDEGLRALRLSLKDGKLGVRARLHAVWLLACGRLIDEVFDVAKSDADVRVRIQAIRAIADLADPVLARHKLSAGRGDAVLAARLAGLAEGGDSRLQREIVIALGRLRWTETPTWLTKHLGKLDPAFAHAAQMALRNADNWPEVLKLLDHPRADPLRTIAQGALAGQYEGAIVDGLIERLRTEASAARRRAYADLLTRVHRKPGPWVYWGYRPPPRPANTVDWDRTEAITTVLERALTDRDLGVRLSVLTRMRREKVPVATKTLTAWLREERDAEAVVVLLEALRDAPAADMRISFQDVVRGKEHGVAVRFRALELLVAALDKASAAVLLDLGRALEDGPVLAEALRQTAKYPELEADPLLVAHLGSPSAEVRAAAIETLGNRAALESKDYVLKLLADPAPDVRRAAAFAAGKLAVKPATDSLVKLARDEEASVRRASLDALRRLRESCVVPLAVAALDDWQTQQTALECLAELGGPDQAGAIATLVRRNPTPDLRAAAVRVLGAWRTRVGLPAEKYRDLDRLIAEIHGAGALVRWAVTGPVPAGAVAGAVERFASPGPTPSELPKNWRFLYSAGSDSRVDVGPAKGAAADAVWFAYTDVVMSDAGAVEFIASAGGLLQVWLNGKSLHKRALPSLYRPGSDRFKGELLKGSNRLLVQIAAPGPTVQFHLDVRRLSGSADHERLTQAALARAGDPKRGSKVFFNAERSLCIKCHRVGDTGERIGPELTGIGARFSRVYLIESILEPSRTVVPAFSSVLVSLKDGRIVTGVKVTETETMLTLADNEGKKHEIKKADIDEQRPVMTSTMPEGLEKRLTEQEFVDLVAFLVGLKDRGPPRLQAER